MKSHHSLLLLGLPVGNKREDAYLHQSAYQYFIPCMDIKYRCTGTIFAPIHSSDSSGFPAEARIFTCGSSAPYCGISFFCSSESFAGRLRPEESKLRQRRPAPINRSIPNSGGICTEVCRITCTTNSQFQGNLHRILQDSVFARAASLISEHGGNASPHGPDTESTILRPRRDWGEKVTI